MSFASYLKKIFCRAVLKCLKKNTKNQQAMKHHDSKKKHPQPGHHRHHSHLSQIPARHSVSGKKQDVRDYWGSKHGSEWLFGKAQATDQSHLLEIVDAFRTSDLKHSRLRQRIAPNYFPRNESCPQHGGRVSYPQCACGHPACPGQSRSMKPSKRNRRGSESEWSLSTMQMDRRPYSRWPPSRPQKPLTKGVYNEPLSSVLSRMNMYLYNWVYVDHLKLNQSSTRFVQSLGTLERYRQKLTSAKSGTRWKSSSRASSVISVCSSKCCENKVKAVSSVDKYYRLQNRIHKKVLYRDKWSKRYGSGSQSSRRVELLMSVCIHFSVFEMVIY